MYIVGVYGLYQYMSAYSKTMCIGAFIGRLYTKNRYKNSLLIDGHKYPITPYKIRVKRCKKLKKFRQKH